jgi:hypothetical protein
VPDGLKNLGRIEGSRLLWLEFARWITTGNLE